MSEMTESRPMTAMKKHSGNDSRESGIGWQGVPELQSVTSSTIFAGHKYLENAMRDSSMQSKDLAEELLTDNLKESTTTNAEIEMELKSSKQSTKVVKKSKQCLTTRERLAKGDFSSLYL
jgi:hypothetical protein